MQIPYPHRKLFRSVRITPAGFDIDDGNRPKIHQESSNWE
jgi:hypothetical protein